ncbi:MAG: FkbM family methyltransferase [Acidimicrobiales bacterium]
MPYRGVSAPAFTGGSESGCISTTSPRSTSSRRAARRCGSSTATRPTTCGGSARTSRRRPSCSAAWPRTVPWFSTSEPATAVEADPDAARGLRANVALKGSLTGGRVTVIEAALGSIDGTASFCLSGGNSSLNPQFRDGATPTPVTVRRGDSVLGGLALGEPVGLVKGDTEATEPDVLADLDETVRLDRCVIVCEVLPGRTEDGLQDFVTRHDYWVWRSRRRASCGSPA